MNNQTLPIALIGAPASYHYQVAVELFGEEAQLQYMTSFSAVFSAVVAGTHRGVVAVHNSIMGQIAHNIGFLFSHSAKILVTQYVDLPIQHRLITARDTPITAVTKVISHPAALQQCSNWLSATGSIEVEERLDNASAIREVCQLSDPSIAAIGNEYAAKFYGGHNHHIHITNQPNNVTTFAVIEPANT